SDRGARSQLAALDPDAARCRRGSRFLRHRTDPDVGRIGDVGGFRVGAGAREHHALSETKQTPQQSKQIRATPEGLSAGCLIGPTASNLMLFAETTNGGLA